VGRPRLNHQVFQGEGLATIENRTVTLDRESGMVRYDDLPVFIIPRDLLVDSATEFAKVFNSMLGRGMIGMYRMISYRMGEKIFRIHLPPGAEGKTDEALLDMVFARFIESGWGSYTYAKNESGYDLTVNNFWLGRGLKGMDKKPVCALMEGILASLFERAFQRPVRVNETECVALGAPCDKFQVAFQSLD
jgi:predicted hydrocarbon binding protein